VHVTTAFVTHDQEEAMDVADTIVVIAKGHIEQTGTPGDLYDRPATDFVMNFLGPVTQLAGTPVRPHDLEILLQPTDGAVPGTVARVVKLGFEVRVDVDTADGETWVQLTRGEADRLALTDGAPVSVRVVPAPTTEVPEGATVEPALDGTGT
jgi:sulfate transport system ATP-binding protein